MLTLEKQNLLRLVDRALDDIRPHLAVDGGNIEVVDIDQNNVVIIRWQGTCEFCSMSAMTMKAGVEQAIQSKIPEITGVKAENGVG